MRWFVEIVDIDTDKRFLSDLLAKLNISLVCEGDKTYLVSSQFESLSTSSEVWNLAKRIHGVVSEVSNGFPNSSISFELGKLYEQKDDGYRQGHVFLTGTITASSSIMVSGCGIVVTTNEISDEERARLEAERLELEYQKKLALVSARVAAVIHNERALKVHRILQEELNAMKMYHIYELIRDDLGNQLNKLASNKEWARFTRSVNHPDVFGDDSRHITSKDEPPPNPMSLREAQDFISKVAHLWFQQKSVDINNCLK